MGRGFVNAAQRCSNASAARRMLALALDGSLRVDAARRRHLPADHGREGMERAEQGRGWERRGGANAIPGKSVLGPSGFLVPRDAVDDDRLAKAREQPWKLERQAEPADDPEGRPSCTLCRTKLHPALPRSDRHPVAIELVVLVVAALSGAEVPEVVQELYGRKPLHHLEAQLVLAAQPYRSAVQHADRGVVHVDGQHR